MALSLFKKTEQPPALQALRDAQAELDALKQQQNKLATQDNIARSELDAAQRAAVAVTDLRRKIAEAKADITVTGSTTADIAGLEAQLASAEHAVRGTAIVAETAQAVRARLARLVLDIIAKLQAVHDRLPVLKHAALAEQRAALAKDFVDAQNRMLDIWIKVFGLSYAMDQLNVPGRQPAGALWNLDWVMPLPVGLGSEAFAAAVMGPGSKEKVHKAIKDEAQRVAL